MLRLERCSDEAALKRVAGSTLVLELLARTLERGVREDEFISSSSDWIDFVSSTI